jgi:hypothetical protein
MRRRLAAGLTVLEVLVASAILLTFLTAVFGLVFMMGELRNGVERAAAPYAIGPAVLDLVAEDLRHALLEPYEDVDAFKAEGDTMGGADTTKIDFVTAVSSRSKVEVDDEWVRAAICEVGYRLRRSETADGLFALYRREDFGVDENPLEGGKYYKLCDRVVVFRIDLFAEDPGTPDSDEAEGELEWDAETEERLPWGARITLSVMPPVEVDDRGDPIEDVEPLEFVRFVNFIQRFDAVQSGSGNPANSAPGSGR